VTPKSLFRAAAACAALAVVSPGSARAAPCALVDLRWMAASWLNADDPKGAQERWTLAPGGVLMGSSFEFPPGKPGYAEIMTIREADAGVYI